MSNYRRAAYHPRERRIRAAWWLDNHFGKHSYGVQFEGDARVFRPADVEIPLDRVFVDEKADG